MVHLAGGALFHRHIDLAGFFNIRQREFRRGGRLLLDVARHQVHILLAHLTRGLPVGHAGRAAVGDEDLQVVGALAQGDVGRQRLAGGPLAQHAVTAGAALEIDLAGAGELRLGHRRRFGVEVLVHFLGGQWRATGLVGGFGRGDRLGHGVGVRQRGGQGQAGQQDTL